MLSNVATPPVAFHMSIAPQQHWLNHRTLNNNKHKLLLLYTLLDLLVLQL
jgi:hypothetical protein